MSYVCIEDFCGTDRHGFHVEFWADWDGQRVFFGGDWKDVPPMLATEQPTTEQVHNWAHKHISVMTILSA